MATRRTPVPGAGTGYGLTPGSSTAAPRRGRRGSPAVRMDGRRSPGFRRADGPAECAASTALRHEGAGVIATVHGQDTGPGRPGG